MRRLTNSGGRGLDGGSHLPRAVRASASANGPALLLALWVIVNHLVGKGHVYEPVAQMLPGPLQAIISRRISGSTNLLYCRVSCWRGLRFHAVKRANLWPVPGGSLRAVYPGLPAQPADCAAVHVQAKDRPKAGWWRCI